MKRLERLPVCLPVCTHSARSLSAYDLSTRVYCCSYSDFCKEQKISESLDGAPLLPRFTHRNEKDLMSRLKGLGLRINHITLCQTKMLHWLFDTYFSMGKQESTNKPHTCTICTVFGRTRKRSVEKKNSSVDFSSFLLHLFAHRKFPHINITPATLSDYLIKTTVIGSSFCLQRVLKTNLQNTV